MDSSNSRAEAADIAPGTITLPAPTAWPIILAFGITLLFAGLVTNASLSILGAILAVTACVGWFRNVLPQEKEEILRVTAEVPFVATTSRREVERLAVAPELSRALLPLETYPLSAGIKGGLAGTASLDTFHLSSFSIAVVIHLLTSLLVGLLYGAMLPMFPRRPILLGGIIAPILWTGLLYSMLELLNPLLNKHIDWLWFIASQFAFGIVAGLVVMRQERVPTHQFVPFAIRAGIEAPGMTREKPRPGESK